MLSEAWIEPSSVKRGSQRESLAASTPQMFSGFKNFYSKSVDLIKQAESSFSSKGQSAAVPTIAPEKTHPGYYLVERCCPHTVRMLPACDPKKFVAVRRIANAGALCAITVTKNVCHRRLSDLEMACSCDCAHLTVSVHVGVLRYERTWGEVAENSAALASKVSVSCNRKNATIPPKVYPPQHAGSIWNRGECIKTLYFPST